MSDKETNLIASFAFFVDTRNSSSFSSVSPLADVRPAQVAGSSLILSGGDELVRRKKQVCHHR